MDQTLLTSQQKVPFVCFSCRVAVKLPLDFYWEEAGERHWASRATPQCPTCKKPMAYLGRYFKVPPRTAVNQWLKAELLWRNNWIADGYSGAPKTLRDAREFIQKPDTTVARRSQKRRLEAEERWRQLRAKRAHLLRHKGV